MVVAAHAQNTRNTRNMRNIGNTLLVTKVAWLDPNTGVVFERNIILPSINGGRSYSHEIAAYDRYRENVSGLKKWTWATHGRGCPTLEQCRNSFCNVAMNSRNRCTIFCNDVEFASRFLFGICLNCDYGDSQHVDFTTKQNMDKYRSTIRFVDTTQFVNPHQSPRENCLNAYQWWRVASYVD